MKKKKKTLKKKVIKIKNINHKTVSKFLLTDKKTHKP